MPFAGDYLWISAVGDRAYGTWTDWRDTVQGTDQRERRRTTTRRARTSCSAARGEGRGQEGGDAPVGRGRCPRAGGLDQNIYGEATP